MEIYLDVLLLENIVMNYLILCVTAKFSKTCTTSLRLFLASLLGAAYVILLVAMPDLTIYYTVASKLFLSFLMVAIAFNLKSIKQFFKAIVIFYISTFIFAGAAFSFLYFNHTGGFVRNGIVHVFWKSQWMLLALSIAMALIIIRIFIDITRFKLIRDKLLIPVTIYVEKLSIDLSALVDTGNSLCDPISKTPVVIVELDAIKDVLPEGLEKFYENLDFNDFGTITNLTEDSGWSNRLRVIPFTSLGMENGILIGFKPDLIEIGDGTSKKSVKDVIVGVYNKALSKGDEYHALLGPEIIETE